MAQDTRPPEEVPQKMASPLFYAISENDRQTIAMVRDALLKGRMRLAYQPVVLSADTSRIAFHEGLMRVLDPSGRPIPARDFMGAVEAQEIGRELDCAALAMALATLVRVPHVRLSVNMSARSIGYPRWQAALNRGLSRDDTIGERLILEITEESAMLLPELVSAFMQETRRKGVSFALDDFGSGVTAIRFFRDFSFDIAKIDGQFIRGIPQDADNQVLAAALLAIARQFDMLCVAESVETPAEAAWLQALGVDCLQGYLFGAPTTRPAWDASASAKTA